MVWVKRIAFFGMVNIAIMVMINIILSVLGIDPSQLTGSYGGLFLFCLLWGTGGAFISLFISKWMAKKFHGVKIVDGDPQFLELVNSIHQFSKAAGLPKMPEVGVYESPELNAFATGPSKSNSLVAVSTGLLDRMNKDELEGVLAHEVSHIANGDMVTMTVVQGVMNAFVMFAAHIVANIIDNALRGDSERGGLGFFGRFMLINFLSVIFGLLGMVVTSFFSRWREFRADDGGARLAGRHKMVAALEKLRAGYDTMAESKTKENAAFQSMHISSKYGLMKFLSTHPPLDKRIEALNNPTMR